MKFSAFDQLVREWNKEVFQNSFQILYHDRAEFPPRLEFSFGNGDFNRIDFIIQDPDKEGNIEFELWVDIGLKSMIDIYHKVATKDPYAFIFTSVLGNYFAEIDYALQQNSNKSNHFRTIYKLKPNLENLQSVSNKIKPVLARSAQNWFNQYRTVADMDLLLNQNPEEHLAHVMMGDHRAFMGLIAAYLNGNPELNNLKKFHAKRLKESDGSTRKELLALIQVLESQ